MWKQCRPGVRPVSLPLTVVAPARTRVLRCAQQGSLPAQHTAALLGEGDGARHARRASENHNSLLAVRGDREGAAGGASAHARGTLRRAAAHARTAQPGVQGHGECQGRHHWVCGGGQEWGSGTQGRSTTVGPRTARARVRACARPPALSLPTLLTASARRPACLSMLLTSYALVAPRRSCAPRRGARCSAPCARAGTSSERAVQFMVDMACQSCVTKVHRSLDSLEGARSCHKCHQAALTLCCQACAAWWWTWAHKR